MSRRKDGWRDAQRQTDGSKSMSGLLMDDG
jgi:hypothetical protein